MRRFQLPATGLPSEVNDLLFVAWVQYFAAQRFALQQYGSGSDANGNATYNFGNPVESNFTLRRSPTAYWNLESAKDIAESGIEAIVNDAIVKLTARDFGGDVIYQTVLKASGFEMTPELMSNFARLLGDQVFIRGNLRLGSRILLEFIPKMPEDPSTPLLFLSTDGHQGYDVRTRSDSE